MPKVISYATVPAIALAMARQVSSRVPAVNDSLVTVSEELYRDSRSIRYSPKHQETPLMRLKSFHCTKSVWHWARWFTVCLCLLSQPALAHEVSPSEVEPKVPVGGPFTLVDHTGKVVNESDFKGDYLLVYFGFTHCPDTCPIGLYTISTALNQLGDLGQQVRPLFVTVDPQRDTVDVLAKYVTAFHPRLVGLTGSHEQVAAMAKTYGMDFMVGDFDGEYVVNHSALTFLMNREGEFVKAFAHGVAIDELSHAIEEVLEDQPPIAESS